MTMQPSRVFSLPKAVAAAGGHDAWNRQHPEVGQLLTHLNNLCTATTVAKALEEVRSLMLLGHDVWAYAYMRTLYNKSLELYYATLLDQPNMLLPVVYTPTVGEGCQKFGLLPQYRRGCYVSVSDRGRVREVLEEYARAELKELGPDGRPQCDCIVFSDGGRILGLGDLAAWGMGIPIGKLDLYTVCAGVNPYRTIPLIIDAGCSGSHGNTDKLVIRDHPLYTGLRQERVTGTSPAGTQINAAYYGEMSLIEELFEAATGLFGRSCLLQFEDFNSNDAFPLLQTYRHKYLTYNDDIQGTAAVAVAAVLGGIKIQKPQCSELVVEARGLRYLFHGAGSANLGAASLLIHEAKVPSGNVACTNSKGLMWKSADGSEGSYRNNEQKEVAVVGKPDVSTDLKAIIEYFKPDVLVGAVGRAPGCFTKEVVEAMVAVQEAKGAGGRPIIFALSNPKTQAEITAADCYKFSSGKAIYGSGTRFFEEVVDGQTREPGQVNNFFIFPGMSFGAVSCHAKTIPENFFMVAAEAVAQSLDAHDLAVESVVPHPSRIRDVSEHVATAVVLAAQEQGLAGKTVGGSAAEVKAALKKLMWNPAPEATHA